MNSQPKGEIKCSTKTCFIGHYHQAPLFMKDNEHITHGYRIGFNSPGKIFKSLFMLHNESVNVWTHLLPALILLSFILYLFLFVGPTHILEDLHQRRNQLHQGIKFYSEALQNLTFVQQMKFFQFDTSKEMEQIKQTVLQSYSQFEEGFYKWKTHAETKLMSMQNQFNHSLHIQLQEFELLKEDFQKIFVPYVVKGLQSRIDSEYVNSLAQRLASIKEQLDSSDYDYIQIPSGNMPNPNLISRWPIFIFLFSAFFCLACSATFHLFYPMSGKAYQVFSRLDYAGINILIVGSSFPALYYGMYCNFNLVVFYAVISCVEGISLFIFSLFEYLHRPENLLIKSLAYAGFGFSLTIPVLHSWLNRLFYGNNDMFTMSQSLNFYGLTAIFYVLGLFIYTYRCPERHKPGSFNVCGSSHQIWHMFVVFGIGATYMGALQNLETRKMFACPI